MYMYSERQRSQWSVLAEKGKLLPIFCANAFCKPASCTLHSNASIIVYRLNFFIAMLFIVGTGIRNGVNIVFNLWQWFIWYKILIAFIFINFITSYMYFIPNIGLGYFLLHFYYLFELI